MTSVGVAQARGPVVASVDAVKIGTYDDFTRVVMHVNVPLSPKLFTLSDPNRLVIDLPRIAWNMPRPNGDVHSRLIRDYRFGLLTPSVSRLIFNLNGPAKIVDFKITPLTTKVGYELDIRLAEVFRPFDRYRRFAEKNTRIDTGVMIAEGKPAKAQPQALPSAPVVDEKTREQFRQRRFDPETAEYSALGALFAGLAGKPVEKVEAKPIAPVIEKPAARPAPKQKKSSPKVVAMMVKPPRPPEAKPPRKKPAREPFSIVIDPGHGGRDPGAGHEVGDREASVVLAFSEELMKLLEADPDYAPSATRRSDRFVPLADRVTFARDKNASLFISIHADWFHDPDVTGAGAYMLSEEDSIRSTEEFVSKQKEGGTIAGIDIDKARDDVLRVLLDLERRETQIGSRRFAEMVRDKLSLVTPVRGRFVRHKRLHVLKAPDMPSVLLELGFMSNPDDRKRLASPEWRKKTAAALKEAIDTWRMERGQREAALR